MKDLIQKYWNGETSLQEEKDLRKWLKTAPSTTENRQLSQLLGWYDQEAAKEIPTPINPEKKEKTTPVRQINLLTWVAGIAAAIALILAFVKI